MSIEAMKLALDALESRCGTNADERLPGGAIPALRAALSQQPDNAACKSVQKRLEAQQPATSVPVVVQHRKPVIGWKGETIGYTAWMDGKGLDGWPHRELYDRPAPSVPDYIEPPIQDGTECDYSSGYALGYAEGWNECRSTMIAAPSVPADVVRDAERFRRLNLTEEAIAVVDSMLTAKDAK